MSSLDVIRQHIEIVEGVGGPKPRIAGSRIRVQDIVIWHEKLGMSPDEIVRDYPTITIADVYAALAYYWDHRDEIEQRIEAGEALAAEMKQQNKSALGERAKSLLDHPVCCDQMAQQLTWSCSVHTDTFNCPDALIHHDQRFNEYGLIIHDGGSSFVTIDFCPWCGTRLSSVPESSQ